MFTQQTFADGFCIKQGAQGTYVALQEWFGGTNADIGFYLADLPEQEPGLSELPLKLIHHTE